MLRRLVKSSISVPKCFGTAVWCPSSYPSHTYRHCSDIAWWKKRDEAFSSCLIKAMRAEKKTKDPPVPSDHVEHLSVSPESFTAALAVFEAYKKYADTFKSTTAGKLLRSKLYASFRVPLVMTCGPSGTGKTTLLALLAEHFEKTTGGRALRLVVDENNLGSLELHEHDQPAHELLQRLIHAAVGGGGDVRSTIGKIRRHVGHTPLNDARDWKSADNDEWSMHMTNPKLVLDAVRTVLDMERSAPLLLLVDDLDKLGDYLVFGTPRDIIESALVELEEWSCNSYIQASEDRGCGVTYCAVSLVNSTYPIFRARFWDQEGFFMPLPLVNPNSWVEWVEAHPDGLHHGRNLLWIHHGNAGRLHAMKMELEKQKKWSFEFRETQVTLARNMYSTDAKKALTSLKKNRYNNPLDFISSIFWSTKNPVNEYGTPGEEMQVALHFEATGCCALIRKEDRVTFYTHPGFLRALCRLPEMRASFHPRLVQHALQLTELLFHLSHGYTDSNKVYQRMMCELFLCRVMSAIKSEVRLSELLPHFDPSEKDLFGQLVRAQCRDIPEKKTIRAFPRAVRLAAEKEATTTQVNAWINRSRQCSPMPDVEGPWFCCESLDEYNVLADAIIVLDLVSEFKNKRKVCLCLQIKEHSDPDTAVAQYRWNSKRSMYYDGGKITNKRVAAFAEHHHIVHVLITPKAPTKQMQPGKENTWERFYVSGRSWAAHPCVEALLTYDDIQQFCPMVAFSGCDVRVALNASNEKLIKAEEEKPR